VLTCEEIAAIPDSVDRAERANDLLWRGHPRPSQVRLLRAQALKEALRGGTDADAVAARLGVRADDLEWMMTRGGSSEWPGTRPGLAA
jgi:hypothetical protein